MDEEVYLSDNNADEICSICYSKIKEDYKVRYITGGTRPIKTIFERNFDTSPPFCILNSAEDRINKKWYILTHNLDGYHIMEVLRSSYDEIKKPDWA